jgi:large subunit ribosomal protein L21
MYAIVKTGGKQYRVEQGQSLLVERLPVDDGGSLALEPLLYVDGETIVDGEEIGKVTVSARVVAHERGPKLRIVKFKPKRGYKRRAGHRQDLTRIEVTDIKLGARRSRSAAGSEGARGAGAAAAKPAGAGATAEAKPAARARKPAAGAAAAERAPRAPKPAADATPEKPAAAEAKPTRARKGAAEKGAARKPAAAKGAADKPAADKSADAPAPKRARKPRAPKKPPTGEGNGS